MSSNPKGRTPKIVEIPRLEDRAARAVKIPQINHWGKRVEIPWLKDLLAKADVSPERETEKSTQGEGPSAPAETEEKLQNAEPSTEKKIDWFAGPNSDRMFLVAAADEDWEEELRLNPAPIYDPREGNCRYYQVRPNKDPGKSITHGFNTYF